MESARFQKVKQGYRVAGKHNDIGFHVPAEHFRTIGALTGLLFVDGPDDGAAFIEFISLENHLVIGMFAVR